jgi:8-oxo-dGTP pyrophosphatase MutT (NUDIX family)
MNTSLEKSKNFRFFGAAFFLRPIPTQKDVIENSLKCHPTFQGDQGLTATLELARSSPENWECLLMKRNYLDFRWDHIGGRNEFKEFPHDTMKREVSEEVGWRIKCYTEICRQWKDGVLDGFVYLVIPDEKTYQHDTPARTLCHEVDRVQYFGLLEILKSPDFKPNVKGRIQAFLKGNSDFHLEEAVSQFTQNSN